MRFRLPIAAAALLAVAAGPVLAQGPSSDKPSSEKPSGPAKVAGKTLEQWVKEIKHGDPGRREAAIRTVPYFITSQATGKTVAAEAVPALRAVLDNDPDAACRVYAALTLSGLASHVEGDAASEAVKTLIDRLRYDPQAIVRLHVVWALGSFGPKATAAIPLLIKHIRDPIAWELRQAALSSLASVAREVNRAAPDKDAVAAVAKLLTTGDERSSQVRLAAVTALHVMGKPEEKELALAKAALEKATADPDRTVAVWAWVALMTLDNVTEARLTSVVGYLKDKDVMVRVAAAMALGSLRDKARPKIDDIIDLLGDSDPLVVATAIDVLAGFEKAAEKALPELRKVMARKEHGDYFGPAAAAAITKITGKEEKPPAAARGSTGSALTNTDPKEVGGKTLDQWIKEIKSNADPSVQQTAMRVVPYFGKKAGAAAPALLARLKDTEHPDIACRAHAILALGAIADRVSDTDASKVVEALTATLKSDSQVILRYHAAGALGAYNSRAASAIPALLDRMHDPNSWELRQATVASLSTIAGGEKIAPDGRAVSAIANRLLYDEEKSGAVRMMCVMTLGALGRPNIPQLTAQSVHALEKAHATDPDKSVQIWAEVALMAVDKVTDKGLDDVARHITRGKDVAAKLTAARALGAMGKEAKSKVGDIAKMLADDDPTVMAGALDVLAGFGSTAREAVPAIERFAEKLDQNKTMSKEQREYFKEAAKYAIEQIDGAPKK